MKDLQELPNIIKDSKLDIGKEEMFEAVDIFGLFNEFPDGLEVYATVKSAYGN